MLPPTSHSQCIGISAPPSPLLPAPPRPQGPGLGYGRQQEVLPPQQAAGQPSPPPGRPAVPVVSLLPPHRPDRVLSSVLTQYKSFGATETTRNDHCLSKM